MRSGTVISWDKTFCFGVRLCLRQDGQKRQIKGQAGEPTRSSRAKVQTKSENHVYSWVLYLEFIYGWNQEGMEFQFD